MEFDWRAYRQGILERWWSLTEEERDSQAALYVAAARVWPDPERLYAFWRSRSETPEEERYIEDLITRIQRHLREGTGARPLNR
jgi:hypothetical protein